MTRSARERARQVAWASLERGDVTGWFEPLYAGANGDAAAIQWADLTPNPLLVSWLDQQAELPRGRALVVGCGLGNDAEEVARRGHSVTAFDVSPTAVAWCRARFPDTSVEYVVADLLHLPEDWQRQFDLIVEISTLQVLPADVRPRAVAWLARCLAPTGQMLLIVRGRAPEDDPGPMPWPLTRTEIESFASVGLALTDFADLLDDEDPPVRRFRATFSPADVGSVAS